MCEGGAKGLGMSARVGLQTEKGARGVGSGA